MRTCGINKVRLKKKRFLFRENRHSNPCVRIFREDQIAVIYFLSSRSHEWAELRSFIFINGFYLYREKLVAKAIKVVLNFKLSTDVWQYCQISYANIFQIDERYCKRKLEICVLSQTPADHSGLLKSTSTLWKIFSKNFKKLLKCCPALCRVVYNSIFNYRSLRNKPTLINENFLSLLCVHIFVFIKKSISSIYCCKNNIANATVFKFCVYHIRRENE